MSLRFHVADGALERIGFAYSPLLEAVLSLHVLVEPKHHPLQHGWVRRMRSLSPGLKRSIADFAFAYRVLPPDFAFPEPTETIASFEEELARFASLDATDLALEFLRPLWDHMGQRDPSLLEEDRIRRHVVEATERRGGRVALALLIFDDPEELARRFSDLLAAYWEEAFADEWERLEPRLAAEVADAGRRIAGAGLFAFLSTLRPRLVVDERRQEFGKDVPHDHRVEITAENPLVLVPSAYVWPHVWVNCDAPWPLGVVYPPRFVTTDALPRIPSAELVRVLRAVADDTRLRALRLIAERPRSTQELAPLVALSEAGLSKHLRLLAEAGLVTTRRHGYYVLYSLAEERIASLSEALVGFLRGDAVPS